MGSIFKPKTTVVQAPSQSTTSYDIPPYFKEIQERTLRRGEQEFSKPYQGYQGQRIAQLDPSEIQAENIFRNQIVPQAGQLAGIGQQIANVGATTYDTATAQAYANPYEDRVVSGALSDLKEAYGQSQKSMNAAAIGAGAFGGSRQAIQNVLGAERYIDQVGDTSARLRQAGFESGANRFAQDRATQMSGLGSQLGAAQTQLGALGQASAGLAGFGAQARGIQQAGLAEQYRDFIEEREYGAGQIKQMIGALSGAPIRSYGEERSGYTGVPVTGQSTFGQIAGAATALAPFMSDIRLKKDIKLVGKSPKGVKIYNFKYKGDDKTYQGVMAHQVPQASTTNQFGYLMVDYSKLDVEFKEV
jgi:hypothetical protein